MGELNISLANLYLGFYKGSIGETFALIIVIAGVFLAIKKVLDWRLPVFIEDRKSVV